MTQHWSAPSASGPVHSTVPVPGSKSITNRVLVLAALADGPSTVHAPLRSRDTVLMAAALSSLGVGITDREDGGWDVMPGLLRGPADVDCGLAGTVMRFLPPAAALAEGGTIIRGVAHIRGHETDRIAALVNEINAVGGNATETEDGLIIDPAPLHGGVWKAYADHRMATAGAIIGLVVPGMSVDDIGSTTKTIPDFPGMWTTMLGGDA